MRQSFEFFWAEISRNSVLFPVEAAVVLGLLLLLAVLRRRQLLPHRWWRGYLRLAANRKASVALVFLLGVGGHFVVEYPSVVPAPGIHDEFSYLLAADTFASGRLTNPPHPMRYFFESMHILVEPTYMSMYPPGQGMALALGILVAGHPMAGVWLSVSAMCAAICWMLQGWMRPHWALTGGLISVVRIGWFSYWANSYWGGAVAGIGGALVGGAVPRLLRKPNARDGIILVSGVLILANTRLFEGAVAAFATLGYILWHASRHSWKTWWKAMPPAIAVSIAGVAFMAYYNWTITGNPLWLPYLENRSQYQKYGGFFWSGSTERTYNHEVMRDFYQVSEEYTDRRFNLSRWPDKPLRYWIFFCGPALTFSLLGMWGWFRAAGGKYGLVMIGALFGAHQVIVWDMFPHYAAPVVGAFYLLVMEGLRAMRVWRRHALLPGRAFVGAALLTCWLMVPVRALAPSMGVGVYGERSQTWYNYGRQCNFYRARIEQQLTALGGKHLILVQYSPKHNADTEWVYNRADIDGAPVVWARHVADPARLLPLLQYFRDRRVWIMFPDQSANHIYDFKEHPFR